MDVIVPIHNAAEDLQCCVDSLKATCPAWARVILIDDASSDPRISGLFDEWAAEGRSNWLFLSQHENQGFVATANTGMLLGDDDVVLLNSDTITTPGWLEGLRACLESDRAIATATPFSNNAEICSFPSFCQPNPVPDDLTRVTEAVNSVNSRQYPELPTAVGFCMAISRRAINEVGLFDPVFGRGYGEENDFCRRAAAAGLRNVLCDHVYVAHVGGRSFAPLGLKPGGENMRRLLQRHPDYEQLVAAFIRQDPIEPIRREILEALAQGETDALETL